jgi:hypothetical protein
MKTPTELAPGRIQWFVEGAADFFLVKRIWNQAEGFETVKQRIRDITRRAKDANDGAGPYEFNNPRA